MSGDAVRKADDVSLLGLKGFIGKKQCDFLLDSGASCNFVSRDFLVDANIEWDLCLTQTVKLADGTILKTCGTVELSISFGDFVYKGTFKVLQAKVPLILGMTFFRDCDPEVKWKIKRVYVCANGRQYRLPVVGYGKQSVQAVQKTWPSTVLQNDNTFAALPAEDPIVDDCDNDDIIVESAPVITSGEAAPSGICTCQSCGKIIQNSVSGVCSKCSNGSFENLTNQLRDADGDVLPVDIADVAEPETAQKVALEPEIVPLKQFVRGGKAKQYLTFGIITLENDSVPEQLNFTHRTAHGGDGDQDVEHGKYADLAAAELARLKGKFPTVFEEPTFPVDRSKCEFHFEHEIPLVDENAAPPKRKLYPLDSVELEELKKQIAELLESNRIEPSNGAYGAPILFAKKKDGRLRMCIDYRLLNAQTRADVFPLPRIDEILQRLDGAVIFSKLDLRDGYHQIPMSGKDKHKTAFTCRYGTYQFTVMPFGLMTAPSSFQRMMNQVFFELLDQGVVCYLDDLLIYSKDVTSHKLLLDRVFGLMAKHKLYLKEKKCHLFLEQVNFLGHVVSAQGVSVEGGKIDAVKNWPEPINVNQVQQFLGLCNYYRKFVLRFSELAGPLTLLTRKGQPFVWGQAQQKAFDALKTCLCSAPTLRLFDKALQTRVVCDASNVCIGAVLEQQDPVTSSWHPVEFYSKRLSSSERNYSATDREFVAIRLSLERWRHFLIGQHFHILTDHAALTYLQTSAGVNRRNARWLDFLSQFNFEISHVKGKHNVVADTLSRIPGSELLSYSELCSSMCTLGVLHVCDLPSSLQYDLPTVNSFENLGSCQYLSGIISVNERDTFRDQLLSEQREATDNTWFQSCVDAANSGSSIFQFRNGLLCKLVGDHFCPVIPRASSSTIQVILHDLHSSALGGHVGRRKLFSLVKARFYWQSMYASVVDFCKRCPVCQQNKTSTVKPSGLLQPVENPSRCFDHVSMDFIMQLPTSNSGYDAIFTIVDRFSRLVRFIPCMSSLSAEDAAQLFFDHWICRFGMPRKIISDRDVRFQSVFWQSLMSCLQSRVALSSSYHPQTDGLTERYHRSVEQILRCYCSANQAQWSACLSQCEFALNCSIADAHAQCPFEVVYGFTPVLPLDTSLPLQSQSAEKLVAARALTHNQVTQQLKEAAQKMKTQADKHRQEVVLEVGQKVWLSTRHLPLRQGTRKLSSKWTGPCLIKQKVAPEAWRVELPAGWKIHDVFHTSQLKPVVGEPRVPAPVLLDDAEDAEYEVKDIVGERSVRGRKQYLVRWKGYSAFHDTWEPKENMANAPAVLARWEAGKKPRGS